MPKPHRSDTFAIRRSFV